MPVNKLIDSFKLENYSNLFSTVDSMPAITKQLKVRQAK
jgi:hypothetical protein